MISKTFLKETKELLRDGRVRIAFVIVFLLLAVAVWVSAKQYKKVNEQYEKATQIERGLWDNQGEKNPHSAAHYGTYAFKPKQPLSLVDQGVDKYAGTSIFLEAHNRNEAQFSAAADQTGLARFGDLTPDFILLFIIPLLIILLGYNSFTKEREMGTLTLLKSQGISNWKWMLGKWMALLLPIFGITVLLFAIAGVLLSNLKDFGIFNWGALSMMFLVFMVYYIVFANIVLLVSALSKKSGISLVIMLCVWIIACLAAPKAASNIADRKYPYPTRQEFAANVLKDKKEGLDGHNPWSKEAKLLEQEVLEEYGVDSLHQLPFNFDGYRMQKGEEHEAEVYFKHYNHLKEQYKHQSNVYKNLAIISPFLPTRFLSMSIAHTDYATHWDFADAAETYRIATQKFLNDNFAYNSTYGNWRYQADASFWQNLPAFKYTPPALHSVLSRNASNLLILGIWFLTSFGCLLLSIKKI
ncbi:MAG: ABC transporter permease [Flavobacteriaceae bacterium]